MPQATRSTFRMMGWSVLVAAGFFGALHAAPTNRGALAAAPEMSAPAGWPVVAHRSRWFEFHSAAPRETLADLASHLDAVADRFLEQMRAMGADVQAPASRMRIVFYAKQSEFLRHASAHDGVDASWMGGYYSAKHNCVIAYDDADGEEFSRAIASCAAGDAPSAAKREALLAQAREATREKLTHESVHLLAFNSGLQARDRKAPAWLTEGLAESFARGALSGLEARDGGTSAACGRATAMWTGEYPGASATPEEIDTFYARSMALVDVMALAAPGELAALFREVAAAGSDEQASLIAATAAARFAESAAALAGVDGADEP